MYSKYHTNTIICKKSGVRNLFHCFKDSIPQICANDYVLHFHAPFEVKYSYTQYAHTLHLFASQP